AISIIAVLVLAAVLLVAISLARPEPRSFQPAIAASLIDSATRTRRITVDASQPEAWRFVSLREGRVIERPGAFDWDLTFRRFHVATNGGPGFAGQGSAGLIDSAGATAPLRQTSRDTTQSGFGKWYDYGFTSHLLTPKSQRYLVVAADGSRYILRILSYYCPGARPGCVTIEYSPSVE
ncbi:MAG: HmuY family protein, partial [Longimicrobiales bacterium]